MKFADILKEAFRLTWRFKWFWLAGFAIYPQLIGGYPIDFQYQPGDEFPVKLFLIIVTGGLMLAAITLLAGSFLQPALILATSHARAGTPLRASEALRAGFDFWGRCLLLALLWLGSGFLLFLMFGVPLIIAFINSPILGIVVALLFAPIVVGAAVLVTTVMNYSYRNVVLFNLGVGDSVSKAFQQLGSMKLASIGLTFTALLIPIIALMPVTIAFSMTHLAIKFAAGGSGFLSGFVYFCAVMLSIPLAGYFGAFANVLYTIAHYEWFLRERTSSDPVPS